MRSTKTMRATPDAPRRARQLVMCTLFEAACTPRTVETGRLLVSELVTNAIEHTTSEEVTVEVAIDEPICRVTVCDDDAVHLPTVGTPTLHAESGRGLCLVRDLAVRWGSFLRDDLPGKATWFELVCS